MECECGDPDKRSVDTEILPKRGTRFVKERDRAVRAITYQEDKDREGRATEMNESSGIWGGCMGVPRVRVQVKNVRLLRITPIHSDGSYVGNVNLSRYAANLNVGWRNQFTKTHLN